MNSDKQAAEKRAEAASEAQENVSPDSEHAKEYTVGSPQTSFPQPVKPGGPGLPERFFPYRRDVGTSAGPVRIDDKSAVIHRKDLEPRS
jgi:hypothetical protein